VRFLVLKAVIMKVTAFWDVMRCNLVDTVCTTVLASTLKMEVAGCSEPIYELCHHTLKFSTLLSSSRSPEYFTLNEHLHKTQQF
jgi:hypothetical protein